MNEILRIWQSLPEKPDAVNDRERLDAWMNPYPKGEDQVYIVSTWKNGVDNPDIFFCSELPAADGWRFL